MERHAWLCNGVSDVHLGDDGNCLGDAQPHFNLSSSKGVRNGYDCAARQNNAEIRNHCLHGHWHVYGNCLACRVQTASHTLVS